MSIDIILICIIAACILSFPVIIIKAMKPDNWVIEWTDELIKQLELQRITSTCPCKCKSNAKVHKAS